MRWKLQIAVVLRLGAKELFRVPLRNFSWIPAP